MGKNQNGVVFHADACAGARRQWCRQQTEASEFGTSHTSDEICGWLRIILAGIVRCESVTPFLLRAAPHKPFACVLHVGRTYD